MTKGRTVRIVNNGRGCGTTTPMRTSRDLYDMRDCTEITLHTVELGQRGLLYIVEQIKKIIIGQKNAWWILPLGGTCTGSPQILEDRGNVGNQATNVLTHEACQNENATLWLGSKGKENDGFTLDFGCPVKIMKVILTNGYRHGGRLVKDVFFIFYVHYQMAITFKTWTFLQNMMVKWGAKIMDWVPFQAI